MTRIARFLRRKHSSLKKWLHTLFPLYLLRLRRGNTVLLAFTPEHGNLGDHAIAQSETAWLRELRIPFLEVTGKQLSYINSKQRLKLMNGRTILIHGGGYLGTIWPESEAMLRAIIQQNPKSEILLLPNTIYYEKNEDGQRELKASIQIYNSHKHLKLYAREAPSYETMKRCYHSVAIAPDMVLRMNKCEVGIPRKGCILCLRTDREKTRSDEIDAGIASQVQALFGNNIQNLDMLRPYPIPIPERDRELEKQFDAFRHSELVITDRLHGMIFCAISGTPCIVINSKSPKVLGCYEWVRELSYIQFCDDVQNLTQIYQSIPKQDWQYDNAKILSLYEPLKEDILCVARRKKNAPD